MKKQCLEKWESLCQAPFPYDTDLLSEPQWQTLAQELAKIESLAVFRQGESLKQVQNLEPFTQVFDAKAMEPNLARQALAKGELGILLVAGGVGSRLGAQGPKGCFELGGRSLFEIILSKVEKQVPVAIMVSPQNEKQTRAFFEKKQNFGLKQLAFIVQEEQPLLTGEGQLFLDEQLHLAKAADGNGAALHLFYQQGLFKKWQAQGVKFISFVLVDNPLADPQGLRLLELALREDLEIAVASVEKREPQEKVGVLALKAGKVTVCEYSELPEALAKKREGAQLLFRLANISTFVFSMSFIEKISKENLSLPWHLASKEAMAWPGKKLSIFKPERFIFDVFNSAEPSKIKALYFDKESTFVPLKNKEGPYGPQEVLAAIERCEKLKK